MARHIPKANDFLSMLKEGVRIQSGLDEAVFRNIEACKQLARTLASSYGPNGMNKLVINHLQKIFLTSDAATIIKELEIEHPAAKMVVQASSMQEEHCGDGTNAVIILAGALLSGAEYLLKMGLSVPEITEGYEKACERALSNLNDLTVKKVHNLKEGGELTRALIRHSVMSKQLGHEDFLADLIHAACKEVIRPDGTFSVDNVRVAKVLGGSLHASEVVHGMMFRREVESQVTSALNCKVVIYTCPFELLHTETKGTVLVKSAEDLKNFSEGEDTLVEKTVAAIRDSGAKVVVTGGKVNDMCLHFCNKMDIMVLRLTSKFDIRRLCKSLGATPLQSLVAPTPEDLGHCKEIRVKEYGATRMVVVEQERTHESLSTILLRGATESVMDDIERAIDDGVNTVKVLSMNGNVVPGAGATEIKLAHDVDLFGKTQTGIDQYSICKFAEALESLPRALSSNSGKNVNEMVASLYAANAGDKVGYFGVDIESDGVEVCDSVERDLLEPALTKYWAIKLATDAACTVVRVDQIIMSKQAGGPKPKTNPGWDED